MNKIITSSAWRQIERSTLRIRPFTSKAPSTTAGLGITPPRRPITPTNAHARSLQGKNLNVTICSSSSLQSQGLIWSRNLSTAAAVDDTDMISEEKTTTSSSPPRKRTMKKKDPIIVTERAAGRIKELLSSPSGQGSVGIRLGVKRRGCNGLSYTLNYAFEDDIKPAEERLEVHGVTVIIEPMALFSVVGTVMDWEVTDMSTEFTFENPNSKGECGCGESFNV